MRTEVAEGKFEGNTQDKVEKGETVASDELCCEHCDWYVNGRVGDLQQKNIESHNREKNDIRVAQSCTHVEAFREFGVTTRLLLLLQVRMRR